MKLLSTLALMLTSSGLALADHALAVAPRLESGGVETESANVRVSA